jgi:hypothetical protein
VTVPDAIAAELESLKQWSSGSGAKLSSFDFVGLVATPDLFFAFSELLQPEITEYGGGSFIASRFSPSVFGLWQERGTELRDIEKVMNHVHVSWIVQNQSISDQMAIAIAERLAEVWRLTLSRYDVEVSAIGDGLMDAAATFWSRIAAETRLKD